MSVDKQKRSRSGFQVGTLFGIPLYLDTSWLLIVALVTVANGVDWGTLYPSWPAWQAWGTGFLAALLLFASVLFHELGHSLVAQAQGTKVNSITLFLFGGIASIDEEAKTPGNAFWVAIAGPLVSLGLFILLTILTQVTTSASPSPVHVLVRDLAQMNLILALFNLIPGLPLDGGQVLKAVVWKITGNRFQGVHWAAKAGQLLGWTAIVMGLFLALLGGNTSGLWIALLGWFGLRNAYAYDRFTDLQEILLSLDAKAAMTRDFRVVDANQTIRDFADSYILADHHATAYFAASDGRYRGLLRVNDLNDIERSEWEHRKVTDMVHTLDQIPQVQETTLFPEIIHRLESEQLKFLTVLSPAGTVAGIIDRGDIIRALGQKMQIQIPPEEIRRIKEEGEFPPTFPLQAIAKAVLTDVKAQSST